MKSKYLSFGFVLFVLIIWVSNANASMLENKILQANSYYTSAKYDSAAALYQSVVDAGYESSGLYYNLGNAYFKLREMPLAILYFEKAKKLAPADEDILKNLEVANTLLVDKIEKMPELFFKNWWNAFYNLFNAEAWAWISIWLLLISLTSVFFYITSSRLWLRKTGFFSAILFSILTIVSFGLASQRYYYTKQVNEAIIFVPTITVKSSPGSSSVDLFVLHEGTKVRLMDEVVGWNKIKIANGSIGWLPNDSFKGI